MIILKIIKKESIILNHSNHSSNDITTFDWNNGVQELEDSSWIFSTQLIYPILRQSV